jgi:RNA polymerase sigma factor (sigma-70 family)
MNTVKNLVLAATDSEASLAQQHEAYSRLVASFQDMVFGCAYAVLGDFQLAEDIAQEAFITAWQKLHQLRQPEAFPGWLRRIVLTECNRFTRRKRLRITTLDDVANSPSLLESPQKLVEKNEFRSAMHATIKRLPENDRIVIALFYLKEHSQHEVSAFLEVPLTTVAKRLYSARARLSILMKEEFKQDVLAHRPSRDRSFAERVAAGIFDEYVGVYRYEQRPEITVEIKREGNRLIAESAGQINELYAQNDSDNELSTKEFDGRGQIVRDGEGRVTHYVYFEFGQEMGIARKIT